MRKLLLETMMLRPLSARGVEALLGTTLAAAEAALCRAPGPETSPDDPRKAALEGLQTCGFAALLQLNKERLVSGGAGAGGDGTVSPFLPAHVFRLPRSALPGST